MPAMFRMSAGGARLRPYQAGGAMAGPAITVRTAPGDNLMVHMALNLAEKGDVIVVDAGGELTNAIIGERMLAYCQRRAFAGIVINGAVLVLGDDDGLLCAPYEDVEAVYKLAHEKHEMETRTFNDIGKGDNNRAQYEKTLRQLGCEFEN